MKFKLLPPAARELREAASYYETRVSQLGFDFISEIRGAIRRILDHPQAWHPLDDNIRRCRTNRFPYGIIYTIENDEVIVISVMHLHRHPESWRRNLD